MKKVAFLFLVVVLLGSSCVNEHEPILVVKEDYYFTDIVKIFEKHGCLSCHAQGNKYDYVLLNWVDTTVSAETNLLYQVIKEGGSMNNKNSKVPESDVAIILKWLQNGALEGAEIIDTTTPPPTPKDSSYYTQTIYPIFKNTCMGCHHSEDEIVYNTLFATNNQGAIWIQDKNNVSTSLVYEKLTTGSMSSYITGDDRTTVLNWLLDGANKSQYSYDTDIKPMFVNNCITCHDFVNDYSSVMTSWVSKTVPAKSTVLYNSIKVGGSMNEHIPADSIINVLNWIREGAEQ